MFSSRQSIAQDKNTYKPTQKQITNLLIGIQGKGHELKQYRELLLQKQEFEKNNQIVVGGFQRLTQILDPRITKMQNVNQTYEVGGMCSVCYQQIRGRGQNCNICRKSVCRKCIARNRMMKNGSLNKFCQNCDNKYLQAMVAKQFLKEFILRQKGFQTLIRQQQALQILSNGQMVKIKSLNISEQKKQIINNEQKIKKLKHLKENNKEKVQELNNKIQWGQSMTKNLKLKLRKLKKLQKQSFGSSNSDNIYVEWQPPKAQDDMQLETQNLNQSFMTSNIQKNVYDFDQQERNTDKNTCECQII